MSNWFSRLLGKEENIDEKVNEKLQELLKSGAFDELLDQKAKENLRKEREQRQIEAAKEKRESQKKIEEARKNLNYLSKELKESSEPHVTIVSGKFTKENGLEIELDWNDAFIRYLKASGITAENDEEIVRKWLAALSKDIDRQVTAENYLSNGVDTDETFEGNFFEVIEQIQDDEEKPSH